MCRCVPGVYRCVPGVPGVYVAHVQICMYVPGVCICMCSRCIVVLK